MIKIRDIKESHSIVSIFLVALIIRLVFVVCSYEIPSADACVYDRLGLSLSQGRGYVDRGGTPHLIYPPFYPLFLSIIYRFFGHSYVAVKIIQSIFGSLGCVFISLIGKRIGGIVVGLLSSIVSILYFPFIKSASLLLTELFFTFLLLLIVFYLLKVNENKGIWNSILLGLFLGIAILTKSIMLFFPFFIIPVFVYSNGKQFFKRYVLVLIFLSLPMVPWIVRNYNIYHSFIPTSVGGGLAFYSSYCPAKGIFGLIAAADDPVIIEANKIPSPVLRNKFLVKRTFEFVVNNPTKTLKLMVKKIVYFWAPFDWEIVGNRWFNFVYVVMLPFFGLGFFWAIKKLRKNFPILIPIIYFQIMTLIFYGSPRFRLPIEPYLFILGVVGMLRCWRWTFIGLRR